MSSWGDLRTSILLSLRAVGGAFQRSLDRLDYYVIRALFVPLWLTRTSEEERRALIERIKKVPDINTREALHALVRLLNSRAYRVLRRSGLIPTLDSIIRRYQDQTPKAFDHLIVLKRWGRLNDERIQRMLNPGYSIERERSVLRMVLRLGRRSTS